LGYINRNLHSAPRNRNQVAERLRPELESTIYCSDELCSNDYGWDGGELFLDSSAVFDGQWREERAPDGAWAGEGMVELNNDNNQNRVVAGQNGIPQRFNEGQSGRIGEAPFRFE
jgi:hypothetical protein